jgi:hypothetical protein
MAGEHDDGHAAKARDHLQADLGIHVRRHRQVQQHQLGPLALERGERLPAVAGHRDRVAEVAQERAPQPLEGGFVVDE